MNPLSRVVGRVCPGDLAGKVGQVDQSAASC